MFLDAVGAWDCIESLSSNKSAMIPTCAVTSGWTDVDLSDTGRTEARWAGKLLRTEGFKVSHGPLHLEGCLMPCDLVPRFGCFWRCSHLMHCLHPQASPRGSGLTSRCTQRA